MASAQGYKSIMGNLFGIGPNGPLFKFRPVYQDEVGVGSTWYVSSAIAASDGQSPSTAVATVALAIAKAAAGDKIVVLEGHTETISTATALGVATANLTIVGLGYGPRRPKITFDTLIGATIAVSAAGNVWDNIIFSANYADITTVFTLTTAANFQLRNCRFQSTATNMNFLVIVTTASTTNAADNMSIVNCKWIEPDTATTYFVNYQGINDGLEFSFNFCNLGVNNNKALINVANSMVVTNVEIMWNRTFRLNTDTSGGGLLFHTNGSTNSGIVSDNRSQHADTAAELIVTASSGLSLMQNYSSGVNGNSGYIIATIDS